MWRSPLIPKRAITDPVGVDGQSLTRSRSLSRLAARAPRLVFCAVAVVLCVAGVRSVLASPRAARTVNRVTMRAAVGDPGADSFAADFARVYLSWSATAAGERDIVLARMVSPDLGDGAGFEPPSGSSQSVHWTLVEGDSRRGNERVVTVAAGTSHGDVTLAVPVVRDARGLLSVPTYPAIVGPPPAQPVPSAVDPIDVSDSALLAVAHRAVANYLARSVRNLSADLTDGAVVVMPASSLSVARFDSVTWLNPGATVAVVVDARGRGGVAMTLRYELAVIRQSGRWLVRAVEINPIHPEDTP